MKPIIVNTVVKKKTVDIEFARAYTLCRRKEDKVVLIKEARKIAKANGRKIDPETVKGLKAIEVIHKSIKRCKASLSKTWEKLHRTSTSR